MKKRQEKLSTRILRVLELAEINKDIPHRYLSLRYGIICLLVMGLRDEVKYLGDDFGPDIDRKLFIARIEDIIGILMAEGL